MRANYMVAVLEPVLRIDRPALDDATHHRIGLRMRIHRCQFVCEARVNVAVQQTLAVRERDSNVQDLADPVVRFAFVAWVGHHLDGSVADVDAFVVWPVVLTLSKVAA